MHDSRQPLVFSVITVTCNAEKVLESTIRSVMNQTYRRVEHIIVDGASSDNTLSVIRKYRKCLHAVISEPDAGVYDAMNKGSALAGGDYLCFLNAGDCFHADDTLQCIADGIGDGELPDVLYGETAIVDGQRRFLRMRRLSAPDKLTWKSFRWGMLVCHQAFFAKRTLAEPYDTRYRYSADFDWCIRVMKKARVLHHTHLTVADYLAGGLTTQHHADSLRERFLIMARHYGWASTVVFHVWFVIRAFFHR